MRTIEISIKEILVYILYKWVPILLCAVAFAALMGGYNYIKIPQGAKLDQMRADNLIAVDKAKASIKGLTEEIAFKQAEIEKYYSASSFTNKKIASIKAEISFNPSESKINVIRSRYAAMFRDLPLKGLLSDIVPENLEEESLRLIARVSIQISADSPNILTISAIGGDEVNPRLIVDAIYNYYVEKLEESINKTSPHNFEIVSTTITDALDEETLFDDEIEKQQKLINTLSAEIRAKEDSIRQLAYQLQTMTSLTNVFISALTGAAVGIVIGVFVAMLHYFMKVIIVIPEQIQKRLGIRYIGGAHNKKRYGFSVLADKTAGGYLTFSTKDEAADYIGISLCEVMDRGSLLITGSLAQRDLEDFSQTLQNTGTLSENIELLVASDVTSSAASIRTLAQAEGVLLVERLGKSTLKQVSWQSERIELSGKKLLGYVLY